MINDTLLHVECSFYEKNREELLTKYPNRFLLIHQANMCGDFPSHADAVEEGVRQFWPEPFLVRLAGEREPELLAPALAEGLL